MTPDEPKLMGTVRRDPNKIVIPSRFPPPDKDTMIALYDSIATHGQLQPIGINRKDELIWGLHRLHVCVQLGRKVRCEVSDVSDPALAEALSIEENLRRRSLPQKERDAALVRLAELADGIVRHVTNNSKPSESHDTHTSGHVSTISQPAKRGRPQSEQRAKRKAAAEKAGVGERTVDRAYERATARAVEPVSEPDAAPDTDPKDELGNPLPPDVDEAFREAADLFAAIDRYLDGAIRSLGTLHDAAKGRVQQSVNNWREQARQLRFVIRAQIPHALCPYCKNSRKRKECPQCGGAGFVGKALFEAADDALRIFGPDAVVRDGGKLARVVDL